jgi:hypothetical protein
MTLSILQRICSETLTHWFVQMLPAPRPVLVRVSISRRHGPSRFFLSAAMGLGLLATFVDSSAYAQANCGPRDQLVRHLSDQFKESPVAIGLAQSGQIMEVFASSSGSWSMVITTTDGKTCMVAAGENWEMTPKVKGAGI